MPNVKLGGTLVNLSLLLCATGCGLVPQKYRLAAEPLMEIPPAWVGQADPPGSPPAFPANVHFAAPMDEVNILVQDSQQKCAAFVDSLFSETAGAGLALDVLSTGTSAVAAIVTPLSTAHALSAASTVFGATKTSITANYLNTLSISHVTQTILSSYNNKMTDYINSLANIPDPTKINLYLERSKLVNIHKGCSLVAAESAISSTLKASESGGQAQGLIKLHTVTAAETDPKSLAQDLAGEINDTFGTAGVVATPSGSVIALARPAAVTLTVTPSPKALIKYVVGPPDILAIVGKPQTGNTITIAGPPAAPQAGTGGSAGPVPSPSQPPSPPPGAGVPPPVAGAPALVPPPPAGPAITAPAQPPGAPLK